MSTDLPPELERLLSPSHRDGREEAWSSFVTHHSRLILHVARSMGGGYDAAMDRYSFVLEQLQDDDFKRLRAFATEGRSKFTTWLVVVVRRLCIDHHRRRYGRFDKSSAEGGISVQQETRRALVDLVGEHEDFSRLRVPQRGNPVQRLEREELQQALQAAMSKLDPRERLLLALRFENEMTGREIARVMDYPTPFHAYRRVNRVLRALREELEAGGFGGTAS